MNDHKMKTFQVIYLHPIYASFLIRILNKFAFFSILSCKFYLKESKLNELKNLKIQTAWVKWLSKTKNLNLFAKHHLIYFYFHQRLKIVIFPFDCHLGRFSLIFLYWTFCYDNQRYFGTFPIRNSTGCNSS